MSDFPAERIDSLPSIASPTDDTRHPRTTRSRVIRRHSKKALSLTDPSNLTPSLDALASLAKLPAAKIVRYLVEHPNSYYGQIQEATEIPTASVTRYLQDLEANGIITGDLPVDARRGRSVRYSVQADYITATLERIRAELLDGE